MTTPTAQAGGEATVVACCQLGLQVGDLEGKRARADAAIEQAAAEGAAIVVLPELATSGYMFDNADHARSLAEPVPGPSTDHWRELAEQFGLTIIGGICEDGDDSPYSTPPPSWTTTASGRPIARCICGTGRSSCSPPGTSHRRSSMSAGTRSP